MSLTSLAVVRMERGLPGVQLVSPSPRAWAGQCCWREVTPDGFYLHLCVCCLFNRLPE